MLISDIISAARAYTTINGASFYQPSDELRSVNRAYRDIYERIVQCDDEFFIKEVSLDPSTFTAVRTGVWETNLPIDFYDIRNLCGVMGSTDIQFQRKDPQDIYQGEGYRFFGNKLRLFFISGYSAFRLEYYPEPIEYTSTSDDIVFPPQLEPLIIAYQMAMDITKMQNGDATKHAEEYARLWKRFELAIKGRDNLRHPKVANKYKSTYQGY